MADAYHRVDVAPGVEVCFQLQPNRITGGDQIINDPIGHLLMGDRSISIAVHIQLDRLELHHAGTRLINEPEHCKVWVAGKGTFTGEFRQLNAHFIGATRPRIVKTNQLSLINRPFSIERSLGPLLRCSSSQCSKGINMK